MVDNKNIVLLHGWGLNSAIYSDFSKVLAQAHPDWRVHLIDLPGYGDRVNETFPTQLSSLADAVLEQAPKSAVWVGWSLGGMVAMQAALQDKQQQITSCQLIATSPCFVSQADWQHGVDIGVFNRFADDLASDYQSALSTFLLLQAGARAGSRHIARLAHRRVCEKPAPSQATLRAGIDCLAKSDLRSQLPLLREKKRPMQVVVGKLDRVANPKGGEFLAEALDAELVALHSGHAPFLTNPAESQAALTTLLERL